MDICLNNVPLSSITEMISLTKSFNIMLQKLKQNIDALIDEKNDLFSTKVLLEAKSKYLEESIARIHNMQNQLLEKDRFEGIGKLTASVAHELRDPLASLNNVTYFLLRINAFNDEKVKKNA